MIACKDADAMVTGNIRHYAASIEKLKKVTDPRPGEENIRNDNDYFKGKTILVADTNVQDFPSPERLVKVSKSCVELQDYLGSILKLLFYPILHLENLFQRILNTSEMPLNC